MCSALAINGCLPCVYLYLQAPMPTYTHLRRQCTECLSWPVCVHAPFIYPGAWLEHPTAGVTPGEVRVSQPNWKRTGKSEIITLDETELHGGRGSALCT